MNEYLFLMWFRHGRRFWFYDHYVSYIGFGTNVSIEHTRERLDQVFKQWKTTDGDVIYSGLWGWFDLGTSKFEEDYGEKFSEVWER